MAKSYSSPKGTRDILEPDSGNLRQLINQFNEQASLAGYGEIVLPLFEELGVFARVGQSTEIVQKQMYDFLDKDERHLVLRPESTAGVTRAYIQHRPTTPWKVWYEGAHFRYERPQAGRFRQFHQVGVEVLGTEDPLVDAEVIALGWNFLKNAGYFDKDGKPQIKLLVNSLGDETAREEYSRSLTQHFKAHELSPESKVTLELNPLRVLDSKRSVDAEAIASAPLMADFLSDADSRHFEEVLAGLNSLGIEYEIAPRLVRGLDYYTRTTFEYLPIDTNVAKDFPALLPALGGGGRYDGLSEDLGGPPCPGIGFAIGLDRTLLTLPKAPETETENKSGVRVAGKMEVFIADLMGGMPSLIIANELRNAGIATDRAFDNRSLKAQMKLADRSGATLAVIVGEDEMALNSVALVELRKPNKVREKTEQDLIPREELLMEIKKRLA